MGITHKWAKKLDAPYAPNIITGGVNMAKCGCGNTKNPNGNCDGSHLNSKSEQK